MEPHSRFAIVSNGTPDNLVSYRPTGETSPRTFSIRIANAQNDKALSRIYFNTTGRVRSCTITSGEDC